ncbi:MAG: DNRLRE domain-containing protein [Verrucomicrobiales bacterium]|nr:DNRLRE domain-containing protein [Verrucomicrobiales bacterium]
MRAASIGCLGFTLALFANVASAETIILTPTADTSIMELLPHFNFGAQEDLPSGTLGGSANFTRSRILVKFDLAGALPANTTIHSAILKLTVTRAPDGGGVNSIFAAHRILRPWGEGAKKGNAPGGAMAGVREATWQMRFHPDESWGLPGGQPGVDYVEAPSSSERVLGTGAYEFEFGAMAILEMQAWLNDPSSNFGWMLLTQAEQAPKSARRFAAREFPEPNARPVLIIEFSASPKLVPPTITSISLTNGHATIRFGTLIGAQYGLQARDALDRGDWETLAWLKGSSLLGQLTLTNETSSRTQRFYRILATD